MTEVRVTLPEAIAQQAQAAGLLKPDALEKLLRDEIRRRGEQSVGPDTDRPAAAPQLANAWQAISRNRAEDDTELSVDPDDYPLF